MASVLPNPVRSQFSFLTLLDLLVVAFNPVNHSFLFQTWRPAMPHAWFLSPLPFGPSLAPLLDLQNIRAPGLRPGELQTSVSALIQPQIPHMPNVHLLLWALCLTADSSLHLPSQQLHLCVERHLRLNMGKTELLALPSTPALPIILFVWSGLGTGVILDFLLFLIVNIRNSVGSTFANKSHCVTTSHCPYCYRFSLKHLHFSPWIVTDPPN